MSGSEASDSDDEMYEVEKIVDVRFKDEDGNDVEVQYRVRWKGFPPGTVFLLFFFFLPCGKNDQLVVYLNFAKK